MAEFPALPLWTDAYLGDTTHLTTIEHGAYLLILMAMWRADGSLPDDDRLLCRYAKMTSGQWARVSQTIRPFFRCADGRISQGRLTDELKHVRQHSMKQSNAAKSRWLKTKDLHDAMAMPNGCHGNAPTPTPIPIQQKEIGKPISCGSDEISVAFDAYNETAKEAGWPEVQARTPARRSALKARLSECGGIDGWRSALARARASPHCCGQNDRGWRASFDFLTSQASFAKLMEGNYDARPHIPNGTHQRGSSGSHDSMVAAFIGVAAKHAQRP